MAKFFKILLIIVVVFIAVSVVFSFLNSKDLIHCNVFVTTKPLVEDSFICPVVFFFAKIWANLYAIFQPLL